MTVDYSLTTHMRKRLVQALSGTPMVAAGLTAALTGDDPLWDRHPDPVRFSLREVMAHLADWDGIYLERLIQMRDRPGGTLALYDETQLAVTHGYSRADPRQSLQKLARSRSEMVKLLIGLSDSQWEHTGEHPTQGLWTVDMHASYILMHDGYHTRQIAEWLRLPE